MKNALTFVFACFAMVVCAQAPPGFNYQGIVRGFDGAPVASQKLDIRFVIVQGSANGSVVHFEQQSLTTNTLGMINTQISGATLNQINWNNGPYFLRVLADLLATGNFELLGIQQFMSVPYALNASTVPSAYVSATNILTIGGNSFTLSSTPVTTLSSTGIASVSGTGPNSSVIAVPSPSFASAGPVTISGSYPNLTVASPTIPPLTSLGISGNIQMGNPGTNSFVLTVPQVSVTLSNTTGVASISGSGTNSVNINLPPSITPTITGAGALQVSPFTTGNNFTLTVPQHSITMTQTTGVTTVSTTGTNSFNINVTPPITSSVTGMGLAVSNSQANSHTVNVPPYVYSSSTGVLASGINSVNITQSLGLTGNTLSSGPLGNAVDLSGLSPWMLSSGNIIQSNTVSNVGIGVVNPTQKLVVDGNLSLEDAAGVSAPSRIIGFPVASVGNHGTLAIQAKSNVNSGIIYAGGVLLLSGGNYNHATAPTSGYGGHVYIRTGRNVFNSTGGADIIFLAGGNTSTHFERMRIRGNNGYVGIGTNLPDDILQIGSYSSAQDNYIAVKTAGGNLQKAGIKLNHFQDDDGFTIESNEIVNRLDIIRHGVTSHTVMSFNRLDNNIGIGTTSPSASLHVAGTFRLQDGTQGAAKVLTSDVLGNATWQNAAAVSRKRSVVIDPNMIDLTLSPSPPTKIMIGAWQRPCINFPDGTVSMINLNIPVPADWNTVSSFTLRVLYASPGTTGNFVILYHHSAVGLNANAASAYLTSAFALPSGATAEALLQHTHVMAISSTDKMIQIYVRRDGANGSDTSNQPMHLYGITLEYMD